MTLYPHEPFLKRKVGPTHFKRILQKQCSLSYNTMKYSSLFTPPYKSEKGSFPSPEPHYSTNVVRSTIKWLATFHSLLLHLQCRLLAAWLYCLHSSSSFRQPAQCREQWYTKRCERAHIKVVAQRPSYHGPQVDRNWETALFGLPVWMKGTQIISMSIKQIYFHLLFYCTGNLFKGKLKIGIM